MTGASHRASNPDATPSASGPTSYLREPSPFRRWLGARTLAHADGHSHLVADLPPEAYNLDGAIQGGIVSAFADLAMAVALRSALPPTRNITTIELKINFVAPAKSPLEATADLVHLGKRTAVLESRVSREGKLVAVVLGTFRISGERA